ncbi:2,3-diketo-L-gulonate reductase [Castellaniella defragrans]
MPKIALKLDARDSVASVLADVESGDIIDVHQPDGSSYQVAATGEIPFGHKIALEHIDPGSAILKYGVPIGRATHSADIGQHIHIHNVAGFVGSAISTGGGMQRPSADGRSATYDVAGLKTWVENVSVVFGLATDAARDLAEAIIDAELCGVRTHGLRRLPAYMKRMCDGAVDGKAVPQLLGRGPLIEVDGKNGVGAHVLRVSTDAVIEAALTGGIGLALVRHSNHAGAIGWAASRIATRGLVGIVISNGPPLIAPPGGTAPFVSNSPIAISAPLPGGDVFQVDMATSMASRDKIRYAAETGSAIPAGWALDSAGYPTQDAAAAMAGTLLPIGGSARGFALILGFEVLAGLLPNALTDILVSSKDSGVKPEGVGHFVLAIDPAHLSAGHSLPERLACMEQRLLSLPCLSTAVGPRLPGRRRQEKKQAALQNGIIVPEITSRMLADLADQADCPLPPEKRSAYQ